MDLLEHQSYCNLEPVSFRKVRPSGAKDLSPAPQDILSGVCLARIIVAP